ncbi:MAG: hypothetical protein QF512_20110 [Alphaproteobacteria bacterium]|nr:hypothetical protein [Alphaproteobacteria bacterium]
MIVIITVVLFLNHKGYDPCSERDKLTVEQIWACDGVKPETRN